MWKPLRTQLPKPSGQQCTQQPTSEEFASMLEGLFVGPLAIVQDAPTVLEQTWTLEDLRLAIKRLKQQKSPDETGLTAELLKAAPEEFFGPDTRSFQYHFGSPGAFLTRGRSLPSECCLKSCVPFKRQTSDLLQAAGFSTRYLGT